MDDRLLRLAEALGIPVRERNYYGRDYPRIRTMSSGDAHLYEKTKQEAFIWSLTGPDLGNVAAVVRKCIQKQGFNIVIESLSNGRCFADIYTEDAMADSIGSAESQDADFALVEAACKAMGIE
jgi:hypothetical protein